MSGTTTPPFNTPQLNNLLGLPMGLGPTPGAAALQQNTMGIDPAALGQLYQAVNRYTLQGTDPGISHSLLGSASSLYPSWSPMHQLANMQAQNTAATDAQTQAAQMLAAGGPPQVPQEQQDRLAARTGNEGSHAAGGLVRRVQQPDDFTHRLPSASSSADPGMVVQPTVDPGYSLTNVLQDYLNQNPPPPVDVLPPDMRGQYSFARGGPIRATMPPNPQGPDTGYISAQPGEYVMQRAAVNRYGPSLLGDINAGRIDPMQLQRARR